MEHAKEQEYVDNENKPKIILGMKITVNFDTSISIPVKVVTEEPKPVYCCDPLRPNS